MSNLSEMQYSSLFATPMVTHLLDNDPQLNAVLRERILAHEAKSSGVSKSNHGGWHSETGRLEFCGEAGQRIIEHVYALGSKATRHFAAEQRKEVGTLHWTLSAWANVNRTGSFNMMHVHPASTWSGTYYVDAGDPVDPATGTALHLYDPCTGRSTTFLPKMMSTSIYINPKPGLTVLFPSYVPHMVFPHAGSRPRISIAFNLRHEPYP